MENIATKKPTTPQINFKANFLLLIAGRLASNLGTAIFNFALSLYVLDLTKSPTAFSLVLSLAILPTVFVNILGAVYVDTHNKKKIIVISDILCGIIILFFMLLFHENSTSMAVFIGCVIVLNTCQAFFGLALNASIPNLVNTDNVARTNSVFQAVRAIVNILGPILGAISYKAIGMEMIFLLNAVSFIISGIAEMFLVFISSGESRETEEPRGYLQGVADVFRYLNGEKILKFLLIVAVILNALLNPLVLMVVQYVNYNIIKVSGLQLSFIESAWAIGTIAGAIIITMQRTTNPILKKFFILLQAEAVLIILWFFPRLSLFQGASKWTIALIYAGLLLAYGMLNTIQNVPLLSHFQLRVPEHLRGRVFGVLFTALDISTPIGMWIFAFILQRVDWVFVPVVSGIGIFILCMYLSRNKYFKEFTAGLDKQDEEAEAAAAAAATVQD